MQNQPIYDLAIIGGGPAGAAAAVYAARKRLKTVFITKDWLGQSNVSEKVENWVGTVAVSGLELSNILEKHAKAYADGIVDFKEGEIAVRVERDLHALPVERIAGGVAAFAEQAVREGRAEQAKSASRAKQDTNRGDTKSFKITTDKNSYQAKTILITSGSHRRKLEIPGAEQYEHKGLTYCATCDGPLYSDQDVAVIGGGNAGFESAAQLLAYCKSVTLLSRSEFKADPGTVEKVLSNPKMKALEFTSPKEIIGDKFVTSLIYTDTKTSTDTEIKVTGIFAEIGSIPNTDMIKDLVKLTKFNTIVVDPRNQRASVDGIWAAGDCTDGLYHQNNIAAGDAVKAVEDIYLWVHAK